MNAPTAAPPAVRDRKAEHIELALESRMQLDRTFFDDWSFEHVALPEIDRAEIDTSTTFLGRDLAAPLLISCMTGGTELASEINRNLAAGAEATRVAVGVGSQRKALEGESGEESFRMRQAAPTVPLLANLGAVQLNYGFGVDQCRRAVEMIGADALVLHLNPLQEAIQPEGQTRFADLLPKIAAVAGALPVPVIAKEVGSGLSEAVARRLASAGVTIVDTAGLGGTSWARIEAARAGDVPLGEAFAAWGIPTPESIRQCRRVPGLTVIGSGGVRNGVDVAKAIALGADLVGLAFPFLAAATESAERVAEQVRRIVTELEITMFCLGARSLAELREVPIHERSPR
ncbi:MAG TPA: type 2 isopentenyl-diphosphate Delta-isomerase [Thermoanaerobaculia bacterium]